MLVYSADLRLRCEPGIDAVLSATARWLTRKSRDPITPESLATTHETRLRDGSHLQTWAEASEHPRLFAVRLTHADRQVPGRQWITELGVEIPSPDSEIKATVLLQTSEISARVTSPVQVTRPRIIEDLLDKCAPASTTPGLTVASLDRKGAKAFEYFVTDERRDHPLVVISPTTSGEYLVDVDRVRSLLAGVAHTVRIPADVDTIALSAEFGRDHIPWLGAISVLFPLRTIGTERFIPRTRILPDQLAEIAEEGRGIEGEILSIVAHRMNQRNARQHIRPESVRELTLRREIARRRLEAEEAGSTAELIALYEEAERENNQRIEQLSAWNRELESEVDTLEEEKRRLASQVQSLTAAFEASNDESSDGQTTLRSRDALLNAIRRDATLEEALVIIESLFPDRLTVLPTAWKSAKAAKSFAHRQKALDLLVKLATSYWEALASGLGDEEARKVFGNAYAPCESETVEKNKRARKLRTFSYDGKPVLMLRHLKIGVKPSVAETLRVHFEWDDARKRIVIGHCGAHLDHG